MYLKHLKSHEFSFPHDLAFLSNVTYRNEKL